MARRRRVGTVATATSLLAIAWLTIVTAADGAMPLARGGQIVLVGSFVVLALVDFRRAAAIALLELVVGGSSGQWTTFPGGPHGRLVLDAIVMLGALVSLSSTWRRERRIDLGRYGPHAVILAIVLPLVWMPLGLLNGNRPADVFSDGNAQFFFAFAVVFVALAFSGDGPWVRRWLLVACAANAVVIGALFAVSVTGLVQLEPTLRIVLTDRLGMGNSIGYMPNGAYRLYLANGLFLQIGVAATAWALLCNWRRPWLWGLMGLLLVDLVATYTRGYWLGAALSFGMVVLVGWRGFGPAIRVVGGVIGIAAAATVLGYAVGFSLPDYLLERASTVGATQTPGVNQTPGGQAQPSPTFPPGFVPPPPVVPGEDTSGQLSNAVRVEQARILLGHIQERPVFGWGFGTIATGYRYGSIPSYELAYLDLAYKAGFVGLLLWLSFPVRVLFDLFTRRLGRRRPPEDLTPEAMALPIAMVVGILITGATNPYILASYGLLPILWAIAWLESAGPRPTRARQMAAVAA